MKSYIIGVIILFTISLGLYFLINYLNMYHLNISMLESWGIVSMLVIIKSGIDLYKKENTINNEL